VNSQKLAAADRARPHKIPTTTEPPGDQGIMDAAILATVEGMEPLEPERRDVVSRMVDERDH
jgi:hypothetical protein